MSDSTLKVFVATIVAFAVCAVVWQLHRAAQINASVPPPPRSASSGNSLTPPAIPTTGIVRSATLHNGNPDVDVAVDQKALLALAAAARIRNAKHYYAVFDHGRAFRVSDGTRIQIIGAGMYSGQVKILQGESAGRTGYVPQEWISSR